MFNSPCQSSVWISDGLLMTTTVRRRPPCWPPGPAFPPLLPPAAAGLKQRTVRTLKDAHRAANAHWILGGSTMASRPMIRNQRLGTRKRRAGYGIRHHGIAGDLLQQDAILGRRNRPS
jgi:hypothetical protein